MTCHVLLVLHCDTSEHLFTVLPMQKVRIKHARFRDADANRKWAVFTFNLPSHNHINIAKYLFSIRDK